MPNTDPAAATGLPEKTLPRGRVHDALTRIENLNHDLCGAIALTVGFAENLVAEAELEPGGDVLLIHIRQKDFSALKFGLNILDEMIDRIWKTYEDAFAIAIREEARS